MSMFDSFPSMPDMGISSLSMPELPEIDRGGVANVHHNTIFKNNKKFGL
jgi:hypothetical protein